MNLKTIKKEAERDLDNIDVNDMEQDNENDIPTIDVNNENDIDWLQVVRKRKSGKTNN